MANKSTTTNELAKVVAIDKLTGKWRIFLSDGTLIRQDDVGLERIDYHKGVKYAGQWHPYKKPDDAAASEYANNNETPIRETYSFPRYKIIDPTDKAVIQQ